MNIRVVETGGQTIKQQLVRTDTKFGDECQRGECVLCQSNPGSGGGSLHFRSGALYKATCKICAKHNTVAEYIGETGLYPVPGTLLFVCLFV